MARPPHSWLALLSAALVGALLCLAVLLLSGWWGASVPPPTQSVGEHELIQEVRRIAIRLEKSLVAMEGLQRDSQGRDAGRELVTSGRRQDTVENPGTATESRMLQDRHAGGPIASDQEGRMLQALPRIPVNTPAVDDALRVWEQTPTQLLYLRVQEIVSRFGFPPVVSTDGPLILWRYNGGQRADGTPGSLLLKISGGYVVQVVGMAHIASPTNR